MALPEQVEVLQHILVVGGALVGVSGGEAFQAVALLPNEKELLKKEGVTFYIFF